MCVCVCVDVCHQDLLKVCGRVRVCVCVVFVLCLCVSGSGEHLLPCVFVPRKTGRGRVRKKARIAKIVRLWFACFIHSQVCLSVCLGPRFDEEWRSTDFLSPCGVCVRVCVCVCVCVCVRMCVCVCVCVC